MATCTLMIPETFEIPRDHRYHDLLVRLVDYLLRTWDRQKDKSKPIPLGKRRLRKLVGGAGGGHGAKVRAELASLGFITINHWWTWQRKSKAVLINDRHAKAERRPVVLHRQPRAKAVHVGSAAPTDLETLFLRQLKHLGANHITLDELLAAKALAEDEEKRKSQINALKSSLHWHRLGQHWGFRTKKGLRFFSDFTQTPKELRERLTLRGEPLIQLDVKQSQPCLLHYVISDHLDRGSKRHNNKEINIELSKYKNIVEQNDFYQEIAWWMGKREAKKAFCQMTNGYPPQCLQKPFGLAFRAIFPTLWTALLEIKTQHMVCSRLRRNERHKQMAWMLQAMEATCVLDDVAARVMKLSADCPILTVHDCVATTEQYVPQIRHLLRNSYLERFGMDVRVEQQGGSGSLAA
jgi:hypothetical protein